MICIPVTDKTHKDALQTIERGAQEADAVELRMDLIPDGDLPGLIDAARRASKRVKIIVTCRRPEEALLPEPIDLPFRKEGLSLAAKIDLLKQAVELGADFVDIELACGDRAIRQILSFIRRRKSTARVIVSWHDVSQAPSLAKLKTYSMRV